MGDSDGKSLLPGRAATGPHPEKQELVAKTVARQITTSGDEQVDAAAQREAGDAAVASGLAAFADAEEACRSKFPMSTDAVRLTVRKAVESARGAFASAVAQEKARLHGPALETYRRKLDDSMAEWTGRDSDGTPGEVAVEIVEGLARLVRVRAASGRCAQLVEDNHRAILQASLPSTWSPCVAGHHVTGPHCGDTRCRSNGARMRGGVRRCFRSTLSGSPAAAHCTAERRGVGRMRCASARARARRAMRLCLGGGFRCSVRRCAPGGAPRGRAGAGGGLFALPRRRAAPCCRAGRAASRHARRGSSHSRGAGGGGCREGAQGDGGAATGCQGVAAARAQGGAGPGARRGGAAGGGRAVQGRSRTRPKLALARSTRALDSLRACCIVCREGGGGGGGERRRGGRGRRRAGAEAGEEAREGVARRLALDVRRGTSAPLIVAWISRSVGSALRPVLPVLCFGAPCRCSIPACSEPLCTCPRSPRRAPTRRGWARPPKLTQRRRYDSCSIRPRPATREQTRPHAATIRSNHGPAAAGPGVTRVGALQVDAAVALLRGGIADAAAQQRRELSDACGVLASEVAPRPSHEGAHCPGARPPRQPAGRGRRGRH